MKVCEVCGALQAESDADKKLSMHLEGKLHTGYLQVRNKLKELVLKREEHKRQKMLAGKTVSRSPTPEVEKKALDNQAKEEIKGEEHFLYSSLTLKAGTNIP